MAGEGQLGLGREDADVGGVRGIAGGSTKVVSARLNSAAIDCICSVEALGVGIDGQRIAAELSVGETSTVWNGTFMDLVNLATPR
jgi:hypothetical protein